MKTENFKIVQKLKPRPSRIDAPPAKAYTLRALLLAALAEGVSTLHKPLLAEDQLNMIACLETLGIRIDRETEALRVHGLGGVFHPQRDRVFVGDSGVTMNFLTAALCNADQPVRIEGTPRLNERPIKEVVDGLGQLGVRVEYLDKEGLPPVLVHPGKAQAGRVAINGSITSQYFSALAIAAPCAAGTVTLECLDQMTERPYFDISTAMMSDFGVDCRNQDYREITIPGGQGYRPRDYQVEGDYSSASFLFLAGAILGEGVTVTGLNPASVQGDRRFLDFLATMGCGVSWQGSEVTVQGGGLGPIDQDMSDVPDLVPPLAVAAAFARGTSVFRRIGHLVHKESNRIVAMENELGKMGVEVSHDGQNMYIQGNPDGIHGAEIETYRDHRIAMSLGIAGLVTGAQKILDPACVAKSFPDFWERIALL